MNNQERIEDIKECLAMGIKVWGIGIDDIRWLVEQVEQLDKAFSIENQLHFEANQDADRLDLKVRELGKEIERKNKLLQTAISRLNNGGAGTRTRIEGILHEALGGETNG